MTSVLQRIQSSYRVQRFKKELSSLANWPEKKLYAAHVLTPPPGSLPDFLIIGFPKCGTSWLSGNMAHHPDIFMAQGTERKELHYFDINFHRSLRLYFSYFQGHEGKVTGEKTPRYSDLDEGRIRFIRAIMPDVKLFLILRNPVDLAWSLAMMDLVRQPGKKLEEVEEAAIFRHFSRKRGKLDFVGSIERWKKVFPEEQLKIMFFEDITARPEELLREAFDFVGVRQDVDLSTFPYSKVINKGTGNTLPDQYRGELEKLYGEQINQLHRMFGAKVAHWLPKQN